MAQRNPSRVLPRVLNQFRDASDMMGHINDLVTCPYDSRHVMKYHKLMRHLPKCEKLQDKIKREMTSESEPKVELERCPYDSLHRFPHGKRDEHFRECQSRAEVLLSRRFSNSSLDDIDSRYELK
ncbi:Protein D7 [Orchesella cincta]|uniref:Protein D7 n=1 Tax=Orchesella cincta TaxID=48709 RepID=A0A1D2N7W6_ORCCI|nr:Protein D7 [Orchesella cincta]